MCSIPQILSVCNDLVFFQDVLSERHQYANYYIKPDILFDYINNETPEYLILSGKYLKVEEWIEALTDFNINASLEIENNDLLKNLNEFTNSFYQIRYPIFLEEFIANIAFYDTIFQKIISYGFNYQIIIIYITKKSICYIYQLHSLVEKLLNLNFMICIFPLPFYFLKKEYQLAKKDFWNIAGIVNKIAVKFGPKIYGDFPVCGSIYSNIAGSCPSLELMVNISPDGIFTPCRFSNINLGNIENNSLSSVWEEWKSIKGRKNLFCDRCKHYLSCRGGCIANWFNSENIDYYCNAL